MDRYEIDFDPADVITAGVEGAPGQRTFFLEASRGMEHCTLLTEKVQLQELGTQILTMLDPPEVPGGSAPDPVHGPTGTPGWPVGSIQLSLDEEAGRCVLLLEERPASLLADTEDPADAEHLRTARLVTSLAQIRQLGARCLLVVEGGRPICPLCHLPIDPGGHVCPASNGHHRT